MDITKKIEEKLKIAEGNIVGSLWKHPDLYTEYNINQKELSEDGRFYYALGENLYKLKNDVLLDEVAIYGYLEGNENLKAAWEKRGGYNTIKELCSIVNDENIEGYFKSFEKYSYLKRYYDMIEKTKSEENWSMFERMTADDIYNFTEHQLNSISLDIVGELEFETLDLTDEEIQDLEDGVNVGLSYAKHSPLLNYLTLGLPKGDLTMFASYVNGGKSSFVTNNILIPIAEQQIKCCVISNEQKSIVYKLLLMIYILTEKLDYWKLTRKKLKSGQFTKEDKEMINKAKEIIKRDFSPYITFVKTYDYDMGKVKKIVKKLAKRGLELLIYDTMKADNLTDGQAWQGLIEDSKELFQIVSKENVAGVITFQLALFTKNKTRFLDESCLANGKQVSEVLSEAIYFRDLWQDEFPEGKHDIKAYKLAKDSDGKFTSAKEPIDLDKDKKYKVFFLSKTRNDENGVCLLYEFNGTWNKWKELGRCHIDHTPSN